MELSERSRPKQCCTILQYIVKRGPITTTLCLSHSNFSVCGPAAMPNIYADKDQTSPTEKRNRPHFLTLHSETPVGPGQHRVSELVRLESETESDGSRSRTRRSRQLNPPVGGDETPNQAGDLDGKRQLVDIFEREFSGVPLTNLPAKLLYNHACHLLAISSSTRAYKEDEAVAMTYDKLEADMWRRINVEDDIPALRQGLESWINDMRLMVRADAVLDD